MKTSKNIPGQKGAFFSPSRLVNVVASLILALQVLFTLLIFSMLPSIVPSHWDAAGHINGYSSKEFSVGFLPIFSLGFYVFLRVLFTYFRSQASDQDLRVKQHIVASVMVVQQGIFLLIQVILLSVTLHAAAVPLPTIQATPAQVFRDRSGCISFTLTGRNFTPGSYIWISYDDYLIDMTTADSNGNFMTSQQVCDRDTPGRHLIQASYTPSSAGPDFYQTVLLSKR